MSFEEFELSVKEAQPPAHIHVLLTALWFDAHGDWLRAHKIAQDIENRDGSWVHAYLHRKEGDLYNARYWYNLAGKDFPKISLEEEWKEIATQLLMCE